MNELERMVCEWARLGDGPSLLATVVRVRGSSYRRPGARMLVAGERWVSGCVSGGCLEGDVMLRGRHRCRAGPAVVTYDSTSDEDEPWGVGLGCHGVVDVLLEDGTRNDALAFARACFAAETTGTLVTVLGGVGAPLGARVAIGPTVELARPVGDPTVRAALERAASGPPGIVEVGGVTALVESIAPSPQLFVLGSGHDAVPLVTLARAAGFRVTVADRTVREPSRFAAADPGRSARPGGPVRERAQRAYGRDRSGRAEWGADVVRIVSTAGALDDLAARIDAAVDASVVIMHHQVAADRTALAMALGSRARYVGVLGPARRTRELLDALGRSGDPRVHAPVGLDIGAETPEQIALAIIGEICAVRGGRSGGKLRERARPLHAGVATIVLAAGGSARLGRPKQLVEIDGGPLVRHVALTCVGASDGPVGVVVGANADAVVRALAGLPVATIQNDGWREGIASSIRAGIAWAEATSCTAVRIALADQPRIPTAHLIALRDAWLAGAPIATTRWRDAARGDVVGAPAVFDRARWDALARLEGDRGAGSLMGAPDVVAIDCAGAALDVDTPEDVVALSA